MYFPLRTTRKRANDIMQFPTPVSDGYLQGLKTSVGDHHGKGDDRNVPAEVEGVEATPGGGASLSIKGPSTSNPTASHSVSSAPSGTVAQPTPVKWSSDEAAAQADLPDVPVRFSEKRRLHWSDKTCT